MSMKGWRFTKVGYAGRTAAADTGRAASYSTFADASLSLQEFLSLESETSLLHLLQ